MFKEPNPVSTERWVTNLSSESLSGTEQSLLKKGLNFAVTLSKFPTTDLIASIENALRGLPPSIADAKHFAVLNVLRKGRLPCSNLSNEELKPCPPSGRRRI